MAPYSYGLLLVSQPAPADVVTPPTGELITLAEAKMHLRVDNDDEDALISGLIAAAIGTIDGPNGWLGRAISPQTITEYRDCFWSTPLRLTYPPVRSIISVSYVDSAGLMQTVPSDSYELRGEFLDLAWGASWPATAYRERGVQITYQAGYDVLPAPIKVALLLLVGHLYRHRDEDAQPEMPAAVASLLGPYKLWRI